MGLTQSFETGLGQTEITLDEAALKACAPSLFDGATDAKKKSDPVAVLRNDSTEPVSFNVILKDGTVENQGTSIPPGGIAVVQAGGEINIMTDFDTMYENVTDGASGFSEHIDNSMARAGISVEAAAGLTRLTAIPKQRVDQYVKLPYSESGESITFIIMKPWGENGVLVPQCAKSGDVLVQNGKNKEIYFNSVNGTLGNFVDVKTETSIPYKLGEMKTISLSALIRAGKPQFQCVGLDMSCNNL